MQNRVEKVENKAEYHLLFFDLTHYSTPCFQYEWKLKNIQQKTRWEIKSLVSNLSIIIKLKRLFLNKFCFANLQNKDSIQRQIANVPVFSIKYEKFSTVVIDLCKNMDTVKPRAEVSHKACNPIYPCNSVCSHTICI